MRILVHGCSCWYIGEDPSEESEIAFGGLARPPRPLQLAKPNCTQCYARTSLGEQAQVIGGAGVQHE